MKEDLEKKIKELEAEIFLDNLYIEEQQRNLKEHTKASKFLSSIVMGTFLTSFFISRKKTLPQAIGRVAALTFSFNKLYSKVKKFLPFLRS